MKLKYRLANINDIPQVLELHFRYHVDSILEEDKKDGFITTAFTPEQITELIEQEQGLFVVCDGASIIAYAMAASWKFWSRWPMFAHMIIELPKLSFEGHQLNTRNSYQYGPVCVDKAMRGRGVFETLFQFSLKDMAKRFDVLVTFINKINPRSYAAHTQKVGLRVIHEFEYNGNHYYELACLTNNDQ